FDIAELQLHISGPAVIALAGMGCGFHLTEQCVHFGTGQLPAGTDRPMAGHGAADILEPCLELEGGTEFQNLLCEVTSEAFDIALPEQSRYLPNCDGIIAKGFDDEAEFLELRCAREERVGELRRHL